MVSFRLFSYNQTMQKWWKNNRLWVALVLGAFALFLLTRLTNLTKLPIFTDEAIYIRWSQIGGSDPNWRFISLVDGKQPLFTWFMMATLRIFRDPLFAGRIVSVFAGMGAFVGMGFLSWELFHSKRMMILSLFLIVLSPFSLMYDRLAIYDSLSAAISLWSLYLSVRLVRHLKLDIALILGLVLGLGMINKTSGFLNLFMLPAMALLLDLKKADLKKTVIRFIYLILVAGVMSQLVYGVLRLSPLYYMIAQKDTVFVHPYKDFPYLLKYLKGNLTGLFDWVIHYLTIPIFVSAIGSIAITKKNIKERILILIWWFAPFFALGYFGKVLYPRFILFMSLPLLTLAAFTIDWIISSWKLSIRTLAVLAVILLPSVYCSFYIVTNPIYAPIPYADRGQMIDDWPSGWGVQEVNEILGKAAEQEKIAVFTEGTFGLLPYAIEIYYWNHPNMTIKGIWPLEGDFPAEIRESSLKQPTFFILNQTQAARPDWPLQLIGEYQKGVNKDVKLRFYKVIPPIASL